MDKGLFLVVFLSLPLISSVCEGSFTRVRSSSFSFLGRYMVGKPIICVLAVRQDAYLLWTKHPICRE